MASAPPIRAHRAPAREPRPEKAGARAGGPAVLPAPGLAVTLGAWGRPWLGVGFVPTGKR